MGFKWDFFNKLSVSTDSSADAGSSIVPSPFFALIIGINEYLSPKIYNLDGAVADALAVKKYLEESLGVPASQIRLLLDAEATRGAIIQEFNNLVADQRIRRGDPILIFYAGHGGEVDAPDGWEAGDAKIQMLIPHDFCPNVDDQATYGIPDRTIGTLLSRVAEKWGDNITVIFDCCYAGSGTRAVSRSSRIARFTEIPNDVPSDLDKNIWSDGQSGVAIAPGFRHHGLRSHILLAACGAKELAYEDQRKGVFTTALLELLSTVGAHNVTYANLLQRLPSLNGQNPQCEGFHRNRILFNAKAQSRGQSMFTVKKEGDNYVMYAGTVYGIEVGDEFTLYEHDDPSRKSSPLGILVVHDVRSFRSTMTPLPGASRFELHKSAFALQTKAGNEHDLRTYAAEHKEYTSFFEALAQTLKHTCSDHPSTLQVEKEKARLSIDLDLEKMVFNILDESVTAFLNSQDIPSFVELDMSKLHSPAILDAAAHFHWHFCHTNKHHKLQNKVRLEFTQVKIEEDEDLNPVIEPTGDNLNQNGVINLVPGAQEYGVKICNDSPVPLYAALFYFDINDFSITLLSPLPAASQYKADPSLQPHGSITFGYGSGGGAPLVFTLGKGRNVEVGFLKLFVGTEYVELSDIEQPSPFAGARPIGRADVPTRISTWDTILATVVVRKG